MKEFRVKDTRFRVIPRRGGRHLLYRANRYGTPSWWLIGTFATESAYKRAAQKNAAVKPMHPVREGDPKITAQAPHERFSGALQRAKVKRFDDE